MLKYTISALSNLEVEPFFFDTNRIMCVYYIHLGVIRNVAAGFSAC